MKGSSKMCAVVKASMVFTLAKTNKETKYQKKEKIRKIRKVKKILFKSQVFGCD